MNEEKMAEDDVLKQIFTDYYKNICIFTGDLNPMTEKISHLGLNSP